MRHGGETEMLLSFDYGTMPVCWSELGDRRAEAGHLCASFETRVHQIASDTFIFLICGHSFVSEL